MHNDMNNANGFGVNGGADGSHDLSHYSRLSMSLVAGWRSDTFRFDANSQQLVAVSFFVLHRNRLDATQQTWVGFEFQLMNDLLVLLIYEWIFTFAKIVFLLRSTRTEQF